MEIHTDITQQECLAKRRDTESNNPTLYERSSEQISAWTSISLTQVLRSLPQLPNENFNNGI
jgi:hypothetical protein